MPARRKSQEEKALAAELRTLYGGAMSATDVAREIGAKDYRTAQKWLDGISFLNVGRTRQYRTNEVARRIYMELRT